MEFTNYNKNSHFKFQRTIFNAKNAEINAKNRKVKQFLMVPNACE